MTSTQIPDHTHTSIEEERNLGRYKGPLALLNETPIKNNPRYFFKLWLSTLEFQNKMLRKVRRK